jgi:hypothetical protein
MNIADLLSKGLETKIKDDNEKGWFFISETWLGKPTYTNTWIGKVEDEVLKVYQEQREIGSLNLKCKSLGNEIDYDEQILSELLEKSQEISLIKDIPNPYPKCSNIKLGTGRKLVLNMLDDVVCQKVSEIYSVKELYDTIN